MSAPGPPQINPRPASTDRQLEFWWQTPELQPGDPDITSYQLACDSIEYVANFGPSTFTARVPNLTNNQNYQFTIAAANANGLGTPAVYRNVQAGLKPTKNSVIRTTMLTSTTANVEWTFTQNEAEAINLGFAVTATPSTLTASTLSYSAKAVDRSRIIRDLEYDIYKIKVYAVNDAGWQRLNTTNTITLNTNLFTSPPTRARNVFINQISWSSFTTNYTPGLNASNTTFLINSLVTGAAEQIDAIAPNQATARFDNLTGSTQYGFSIVTNNNIASVSTTQVIVRTLIQPPSPITISSITNILSTSFTVNYTGGIRSSSYVYTFNGIPRTPASSSDGSASFSGLSAGTLYSVIVIGTNASGHAMSAPYVVTTPLVKPTDVAISNSGPQGFTVTWTSDPSAVTYNITATDQNNVVRTYTGVTSPKIIDDLTGGQTYSVVVIAVNGAVTASSDPVIGLTGPGVPTNLNESAASQTGFTITWTAASGATSYNISSDGGANFVPADTNTMHSFSGLTNGTLYPVIVQAQDSIGTTNNSATFNAYTTPGAPVISFSSITEESFTATWSGATGAISYTYEISPSEGTYVPNPTDTTGTVTWSNLTYSKTYDIVITAINSVGSTPSSNSTNVWTERTNAGPGNWYGFASSADGTKLVTGNYGGSVYTSTNSGLTWVERTGPGTGNWTGFASSADGTVLVTGNETIIGYIYSSRDSGLTWTVGTDAGRWNGFAMSSDGTKIVAGNSRGSIYTSSNSGISWVQSPNTAGGDWAGFASSADGNKLVTGRGLSAIVQGIYTSTDSGATWINRGYDYVADWWAFASSEDGTKLLTGNGAFGNIYTSTDSGITWTARQTSLTGTWRGFGSSADGTKLIAGNTAGYIYLSTDSGISWTEQTIIGTNDWNGVASNNNGTKLVCGSSNGGSIYTYNSNYTVTTATPLPPQPTTQPVLTVTEMSPSAYTISWTGGDNATSYIYNINGAPVTPLVNNGVSAKNATISGLLNENVTVEVIAVNSLDSSTSRDFIWTERTSIGLGTYIAFFSSVDGTKLVTQNANGGFIYTSTDSGVNWTIRTDAGFGSFYGIGGSSDGTNLVTGAFSTDSPIYKSTDSGVTWIQQTTTSGASDWSSFASSADGTKLVATTSQDIYTSIDSGVTWIQKLNVGAAYLSGVASSSDGTKLAASSYVNGYVYTSADSGVSWTTRYNLGPGDWNAIASNSDGTKLITGNIYIHTTTDSGASWIERTGAGSGSWSGFASSSDGNKLTAVSAGGYVHISTDSGVTWTTQTSIGAATWRSIASSSDGNKLVAGNHRYIYTYAFGFPMTVAAPSQPILSSSNVDSSGFTVNWTGADRATSYTYKINGTPTTPTTDNAFTGKNARFSAAPNNTYLVEVIATNFKGSISSAPGWLQRNSAGAGSWSGFASSADGTKLVAGNNNNGSIYTTTDSGGTWIERTFAGNNSWAGFASSADGTKLVTGISDGGYIHTSTDSGVTWTEITSVPNTAWGNFVISTDGTKLVATSRDIEYVYKSTDSGVTWNPDTTLGQASWKGIASNEDGVQLVIGEENGNIYRSTDSGATWTEQTIPGNGYPNAIASSADGTKLVVGKYESYGTSYIYTSTDSGVTWTERIVEEDLQWNVLTSSADGTRLAVIGEFFGMSKIYISTDSGVTWIEQTSLPQANWSGIASSSDGFKLVTGRSYSSIYTYNAGLTITTP